MDFFFMAWDLNGIRMGFWKLSLDGVLESVFGSLYEQGVLRGCFERRFEVGFEGDLKMI